MKKLVLLAIAALFAIAASAQVKLSPVDKAEPTDEVFMDMAVTVANTAVAQGYKPCGTVIVMHGAWKSSGMAVGGKTAEQDALARSRRTKLPTAVVYTVNQPTTDALITLREAGVATVFYVNPMEDVVAAGIYTEADYAIVKDASEGSMNVIRMDYAPATTLLKK